MFNLPVTFSLQFLHLKCWLQTAGRLISRWRMVLEVEGEEQPPPSPSAPKEGFAHCRKQMGSGAESNSFPKGKKSTPAECTDDPAQSCCRQCDIWAKSFWGPSSLDHAMLSIHVSPNLNCIPLSSRKPKHRPGSPWYRHHTRPVLTGQKDVYSPKEFTTRL